MITPIEIQKTEFKVGAHGYSKKEVDDFKARILKDYEALYRQNLDLNDHIADLEDKLTRYNNLEKSLQKALILAEKSAEETKKAAEERAEAIEQEAMAQAQVITAEARTELYEVKNATIKLLQQYDQYKSQIIAASKAQIQLLNSPSFTIDKDSLETVKEFEVNKKVNEQANS